MSQTPVVTPPDPLRSRRMKIGLAAVVLLLGAVAALVIMGGLKKKTTTDEKTEQKEKPDPWKVAAGRLKKDTDLAACKSALGGLRSDLSAPGAEKLPALSDAALAALAAIVPLAPADRDEIKGGPFSEHDAAYLADCFYMRDTIRALGVAGPKEEPKSNETPAEKEERLQRERQLQQFQADRAFDWMCRQVYLYPWLRLAFDQRDPRANPFLEPTTLPPTAVLRRGFGSALERMYVFLALLQQLELDGCLIGPPDAANRNSRLSEPLIAYENLPPQHKVPRGPFWAVGVRIGTDVRLYDPWRGRPYPVTLNQLRANPVAAKAWFEDKANASGATLEDAKKATVFLALPVNALSARMGAFETRMKELGANVAIDAKAMRDAFPDPKPAFWNPPNDPFAYGRAARSYLPVELGGADSTPSNPQRLYNASLGEQIPATAFQRPSNVNVPEGSVWERFRDAAAGTLAVAFVLPPNPRERIQRGQFHEASRDLVVKQDTFTNGLERLRVNKDAEEQIKGWLKGLEDLRLEVSRLQRGGDKEAFEAAQQALDRHWKEQPVQLLVDQLSAEVGRAEASYLLALCKHEEAERYQTRLERATGDDGKLKSEVADAWGTALSTWRIYEQRASAHAGFPGRAAHGRALAARAAQFAEAPKK